MQNLNSVKRWMSCWAIGLLLSGCASFENDLQDATNGDKNAQYRVAMAYKEGIETNKNPEQAFYWMKKSSDNGLLPAKIELGSFYLDGIGVQKSEKDGINILSALDDNQANLQLAKYFLYDNNALFYDYSETFSNSLLSLMSNDDDNIPDEEKEKIIKDFEHKYLDIIDIIFNVTAFNANDMSINFEKTIEHAEQFNNKSYKIFSAAEKNSYVEDKDSYYPFKFTANLDAASFVAGIITIPADIIVSALWIGTSPIWIFIDREIQSRHKSLIKKTSTKISEYKDLILRRKRVIAEQEWLEKEKIENEQLEKERIEKERLEKERIENEQRLIEERYRKKMDAAFKTEGIKLYKNIKSGMSFSDINKILNLNTAKVKAKSYCSISYELDLDANRDAYRSNGNGIFWYLNTIGGQDYKLNCYFIDIPEKLVYIGGILPCEYSFENPSLNVDSSITKAFTCIMKIFNNDINGNDLVEKFNSEYKNLKKSESNEKHLSIRGCYKTIMGESIYVDETMELGFMGKTITLESDSVRIEIYEVLHKDGTPLHEYEKSKALDYQMITVVITDKKLESIAIDEKIKFEIEKKRIENEKMNERKKQVLESLDL